MKRILLGILTPIAIFTLTSIAIFTIGCRAEFQGGSFNGFVIFATSLTPSRYTEFNIVFRKEGDRWTGYVQPKDEQAFDMSSVVVGPGDRISFTADAKSKSGQRETIIFEGKHRDDKLEGRVRATRQRYQDELMVNKITPAWLVASKQGIKMTAQEAQRISDEHNVTEFIRDLSNKRDQVKSLQEKRRVTVEMLRERFPELPPDLTTVDAFGFGSTLPYALSIPLYVPNTNRIVAEVIYKADLDFSTEKWSEAFDIEWRNRPKSSSE
jgi:hypothetical protein